MNTKFDVYRDEDNSFYSKGITREFGQNKVIFVEGHQLVASIMPLVVKPEEFNLEKIGYIYA